MNFNIKQGGKPQKPNENSLNINYSNTKYSQFGNKKTNSSKSKKTEYGYIVQRWANTKNKRSKSTKKESKF